ncbi:hypothetical protein [Anaeroarcus burkinensis]|uniref:hypothetical protein n=1 Tax=Anaeroarcus burkinensis TaxID=82376 RepID=UPI000421FB65|nr:hypothetical protein [Anaeroarcus burkinensis]
MQFVKRKILLMMVLLAVLVLPSGALAGTQDFTLVNNSPFNMVGFWVAPANSDNWEENLLEGVYLPPNSSVDVSFENSNNVEWWNFRVKDSSGKVWRWEKNDYNLNQIAEITYYYKSSGGAAISYK